MAAFELYAPQKGRIARWIIGVSGALLVAYGAYTLFYSLPEATRRPLVGWQPLGSAYPVTASFFISLLALGAGGFGMWWVINYARFVDFLHDCEIEMGKVSWASRDEIVSSSIVVVIATIILAGWVYSMDLVMIAVRSLFGG